MKGIILVKLKPFPDVAGLGEGKIQTHRLPLSYICCVYLPE